METSLVYIIIAILVLGIIAFFIFLLPKSNNVKRLTPLAGISFGLVLSGIISGDNRFIAYGLIGTGVVLAVIDIYIKSGRKGKGAKS